MRKLSALMIMITAICLAGCSNRVSPQQPKSVAGAYADQAIQVQLAVPVEVIDPAYVHNSSEIAIARMIFQGLLTEDSAGEAVPCAATKWQVSADQMTYTFHLRPDLVFHNGKKVTAGDFKFSWERVLRLNAPSAYLFANIQGAAEVLAGQQILLSGVQAPDDQTLVVTLSKPQTNFLATLCHPGASVLSRLELVEQGVAFAKPGTVLQPALIPSSIGPYQLIEWLDGRQLTIGRNPLYFNEIPSITRIRFILDQTVSDGLIHFAAGKTAILQDLLPAHLAKMPDQVGQIPLQKIPVRRVSYLGMNAGIAPFDQKAVREAVCYAVNPAGILKTVRGDQGSVLSGLFTDYWQGMESSWRNSYSYDPVRAKSALLLAGKSDGAGLAELNLYCGPASEEILVAAAVEKNLEAVGFKIKISPVAGRDLHRLVKNGEAGLYLNTFSAFSPELDNFFQEQVNSRWQKTIVNPLWDQMLDGTLGLSGEQRLAAQRQLEQALLLDNRLHYLFTYQTGIAVSDQLDHFQLSRGGYIDFSSLTGKSQDTVENP